MILPNVMDESHEEDGEIFSYPFFKWNCHKNDHYISYYSLLVVVYFQTQMLQG